MLEIVPKILKNESVSQVRTGGKGIPGSRSGLSKGPGNKMQSICEQLQTAGLYWSKKQRLMWRGVWSEGQVGPGPQGPGLW